MYCTILYYNIACYTILLYDIIVYSKRRRRLKDLRHHEGDDPRQRVRRPTSDGVPQQAGCLASTGFRVQGLGFRVEGLGFRYGLLPVEVRCYMFVQGYLARNARCNTMSHLTAAGCMVYQLLLAVLSFFARAHPESLPLTFVMSRRAVCEPGRLQCVLTHCRMHEAD